MRRITQIILTISFVALLTAIDAVDAYAGVLIPSSQVTSGSGYQIPRIAMRRAHKSTYAAKRTMPSLSKSTAWVVQGDLARIKQHQDYEKKLYRWEQKRIRAEEKLLKKKQKEREKLEKKRRKEQERLLKKKKSSPHIEIKKDEEGNDIELAGGEGVPSSKSADKGVKGGKPSFWARLKRAVFGK